jgi:hypothetical protein
MGTVSTQVKKSCAFLRKAPPDLEGLSVKIKWLASALLCAAITAAQAASLPYNEVERNDWLLTASSLLCVATSCLFFLRLPLESTGVR